MPTRFVLFILLILCSRFTARADNIIPYDLSASISEGEGPVGGTVTGTIAIDFTNLYATVANLMFQSNIMTSTVLFPTGPAYFGPYTAMWVGEPVSVETSPRNPNVLEPAFDFLDSEGHSLSLLLIGDGSSVEGVCTTSGPCSYGIQEELISAVSLLETVPCPITCDGPSYLEERFDSGTIVPVTTPEPPSLALLATGLLAVLAALRSTFTNRKLNVH